MADNVQLNPGTGGATMATDDDGTAQHPYVKVEFGDNDTQTKVTSSVGLPVDPLDRAARDLGKVDVASLDQYTPVDVDSGAGTENAVPVTLRIAASGGSIAQTYAAGAVAAGTQRVTLGSDDPAVTALQVMDDWDESDRAKVNLIVGQAGVTAGAGAVAANTPRMTLASDDPATVAVQLLDDAIVTDDAAFTPAVTKIMMVGFEFDDTTPDSVNEGDGGAARMSANRNVYMQIRDAAGNERGVNVNASNQLSVSVDNTVTVGSHAVTNAGTFATQDSQVVADNAGFTDGTTKLFSAGFIFDETAGTALTENDAAAARVDSKRAQVLVIEDETTRGRRATVTAANAVKVDGSSVTQPVSNAGTFAVQADTELPAAVELSDTLANPTTPLVGAALLAWDGAQWRRVAVIGTGADAGFPVYIKDDVSQPPWVYAEDFAHGSGDTGAFVLGVRRDADTTPVGASGDYHALIFNDLGELKVNASTRLRATTRLTEASISISSSGDNTIVSATASQTTRVHRVFIMANAAVGLKFRDGTTDLTGVMNLQPGGSITLDFTDEPWFTTTANTAFNINLSAAVQVSGRIYYVKSA